MRVLTATDREQIAALRERGEFFWLDLSEPGDEDLAALDALFGLNPLARRQLRTPRQRAKLYMYGDYALIVFYGVGGSGRRDELVEVHLVVSGDGIVTVRHAACPALDDLRSEMEQSPAGAEQFVVYRVLDALTDAFFPLLEGVDDEIDQLEDDVLASPTDAQLRRISELKRELVGLRKVIMPERDLFARAGDDIVELPGLQPASRDYFRDLYDHLIRLSDMVDAYRDLLTGTMDVYLSQVSNRLNMVMERLTVVATIFLPLTVLTGFFGMNFTWLVEHLKAGWTFFVFGVGLAVLATVGIMLFIRRSDAG